MYLEVVFIYPISYLWRKDRLLVDSVHANKPPLMPMERKTFTPYSMFVPCLTSFNWQKINQSYVYCHLYHIVYTNCLRKLLSKLSEKIMVIAERSGSSSRRSAWPRITERIQDQGCSRAMTAVALLDLITLLRFQPSTLMTAYTAWLVWSFVLHSMLHWL